MKHLKLVTIVLTLFIGALACAQTPGQQTDISVPTPYGPAAEISVPTAAVAQILTDTPVIPPTPETITTELSATFLANNSGSLCPKRTPDLVYGAPAIVGEIDDTWRCEGYWSFDISSIPTNATIISATFRPGACKTTGNPFKYSELYFGYIDVGTLEVSDYGSPPDKPVSLQKCPDAVDATAFVKMSMQQNHQQVQIMAAFNMSDYGNGSGDYVSFQGTTPTLEIKYSYLRY